MLLRLICSPHSPVYVPDCEPSIGMACLNHASGAHHYVSAPSEPQVEHTGDAVLVSE